MLSVKETTRVICPRKQSLIQILFWMDLSIVDPNQVTLLEAL